MKKLVCSVAALFILAMGLVSCGGGSPKVSAEKFLNGLYHMDFAAAKEASTDETKKQVDGYEQMMGMMQQAAKDEQKKIKVEVMEPKVEGDKATVEYKLSNDPTVRTLKMVKKNGKWLAEWSKMDLGGAGGMNDNANGGAQQGTQTMSTDTVAAPAADGTAAPADTMAH